MPEDTERGLRRRALVILAIVFCLLSVTGIWIGVAVSGGADTAEPASVSDDGGIPVGSDTGEDAAGARVTIDIYTDYSNEGGASFLAVNDLLLRGLLDSGTASVEIHPVALPGLGGADEEYAVRAANAAACVGDISPDSFWEYHVALFANQPTGDSTALTDSELVKLAADMDLPKHDRIGECIQAGTFADWVAAQSAAVADRGAGPDGVAVDRMPTVLVDGAPYTGPVVSSSSFRQFVETAGASV